MKALKAFTVGVICSSAGMLIAKLIDQHEVYLICFVNFVCGQLSIAIPYFLDAKEKGDEVDA